MTTYGDIAVERMVVGPISENTYIVWDISSKEGYVIDPGGETDDIVRFVSSKKLNIQKILITHGHPDHIAGVAPLKKKLKVPCAVHPKDVPIFQTLTFFAPQLGIDEEDVELPVPDEELKEGMLLPLGVHNIKVMETPGHSPGHISLYVEPLVFVGDVLFRGSIGRTDIPEGDTEILMKSINEKLLTLPDDTVVLSGHGPESTIAREKRTNPFLTGRARLK